MDKRQTKTVIRIGDHFPVLDKGFVCVIDVLGSDERVAQAARVSYSKGTKQVRDDAHLIDYLMRHGHTSPFEQCGLILHIKMPLFVARQWMRHRTAKVNEISARYSILPNEFYIPSKDVVAQQSSDNRQGRDAVPVDEKQALRYIQHIKESYERTYQLYEKFIKENIARELARIVLPVAIYTECYWQMDLHNLFHFLLLRLDHHAQYEIRCYAHVVLRVIRAFFPVCTQAFMKHMKNAVKVSESERRVLAKLLEKDDLVLEMLSQKQLYELREKLMQQEEDFSSL